ncbi:MAG: YqeG family HAD IIIA-type phosphatase [Clostridia bacterium]|nr:YqeG family HAD IIIA-type phosphatase [Clostridia bacterium]
MKDCLTPDYMFESYRAITPEFLRSIGVRALLIDIDNTLAPYEVEDADDATAAWFEELRANGIVAALVSNNHAPRVERFNQRLGLPAYADSKKPGKKTLLLAMKALGASKEESAMLGDQLLTDAYAGKHLGLRALIVPPIKDKTNLFFKFKRFCERPFIRRYARKHGYSAYMQFWHIKPIKKEEN